MNNRKINFCSGPAQLPDAVLQKAQQALANWQGLGVSIVELSHRHPAFVAMTKHCEQLCRELLSIPDDYAVLFMAGGARLQFTVWLQNLLSANNETVNFLVDGLWSKMAAEYALPFCQVNAITSIVESDPSARFLHYCDNETVDGTEKAQTPDAGQQLLVADMSSNIMSRPIDINKHALIYACAQKNLGMAGITLVIVRKNLLQQHPANLGSPLFNYSHLLEKESMLNTPDTMAWYVLFETLQWVKAQGGVATLSERNLEKAKLLYDYIDHSDFYLNHVPTHQRSRMNVVFDLAKPELTTSFVDQADQQGLFGLKGHSVRGGLRAALYNSKSLEDVRVLIDFMASFCQRV